MRADADRWRFGGTRIPEVSARREAFNITLFMAVGTDARVLQQAARQVAKAELANEPPLCDGLAHAPGQSACAHQRALRAEARDGKSGPAFRATRSSAMQAWSEITKALVCIAPTHLTRSAARR